MAVTDWRQGIVIKGDKKTIKMFHELSEPKQKRILKTASEKGAKLIRNEARLRAPMKTGRLIRNIKEVLLIWTDFFASVGVSFRVNNQDEGYYGLFIEKGTKKRYQLLNKQISYASGRRRIVGGTYKYVGRVRRDPFLEPAFESQKANAARIIINDIRESIFKEAKKYGAKS
jgi:HK97 gp10 family phage protein